MTSKGIDVSKWQGDIDWKKVKESGQCAFAMIRAGYGKLASQKDPQFEANYEGAKSQGIPVGAYWYSYATTKEDALLEAEAFLECLADKDIDYPVFYDVEEADQISASVAKQIVPAFADKVSAGGYHCGLYSYASALNTFGSDITDNYDIWVAHFDVDKPSFSRDYVMWQYTDKGEISGISGNVDLDYSYIAIDNATEKTTTTEETTATDKTTTTDFEAGEKVTLKDTALYSSSDSKVSSGTKSGTYYIYSTEVSNGRIRITNKKSNVGKTPAGDYVTGWVNMSDIGTTTTTTTTTATTTTTTTLTAGDKIILNNIKLYASSDAVSCRVIKSGTYYIYSAEVANGRIRITNSKSYVGKTPAGNYVTGWVNVSDLQ